MAVNEYETGFAARLAAPNAHRELIGGLWDEMGTHQFEYLIANGLRSHSRLIDIGCGSLRAGVKLVPYLEPGHYYGTDLVPELLELGYEREMRPLGLAERLPRENLAATDDFSVPFSDVRFDFALAQSLFSHLPINHLRLCLAKLRPHMVDNGTLFATFFVAPDSLAFDQPFRQPPVGEIQTYGWKDPYHYWHQDIAFAVRDVAWELVTLEEWNHPRGQQIAQFKAV